MRALKMLLVVLLCSGALFDGCDNTSDGTGGGKLPEVERDAGTRDAVTDIGGVVYAKFWIRGWKYTSDYMIFIRVTNEDGAGKVSIEKQTGETTWEPLLIPLPANEAELPVDGWYPQPTDHTYELNLKIQGENSGSATIEIFIKNAAGYEVDAENRHGIYHASVRIGVGMLLESPNGGEIWHAGATNTVRWLTFTEPATQLSQQLTFPTTGNTVDAWDGVESEIAQDDFICLGTLADANERVWHRVQQVDTVTDQIILSTDYQGPAGPGDVLVTRLTVSHSNDGGSSYVDDMAIAIWRSVQTTFNGDTVREGTCDWTVPDLGSKNCLLRVTLADGSTTLSDVSDGVFVVTHISLSIAPWQDLWNHGESMPITWTSTQPEISSVNVEVSGDDGSTWNPIPGLSVIDAAPGAADWLVDVGLTGPSAACRVRVVNADGSGFPVSVSDAFTIVKLSLTIYRPGTMTSPGLRYYPENPDDPDFGVPLFLPVNDDNDENPVGFSLLHDAMTTAIVSETPFDLKGQAPLMISEDNDDGVIGLDDDDVVMVEIAAGIPASYSAELYTTDPLARIRHVRSDGSSELTIPPSGLVDLTTANFSELASWPYTTTLFLEGRDVSTGEIPPDGEATAEVPPSLRMSCLEGANPVWGAGPVSMPITWIVPPVARIYNAQAFDWGGNSGEEELEEVCTERGYYVDMKHDILGTGPSQCTLLDFISAIAGGDTGVLWTNGHGLLTAQTPSGDPIAVGAVEKYDDTADGIVRVQGYYDYLGLDDQDIWTWVGHLHATQLLVNRVRNMRRHSIVFLAHCDGSTTDFEDGIYLPYTFTECYVLPEAVEDGETVRSGQPAAFALGYDGGVYNESLIAHTKLVFWSLGDEGPDDHLPGEDCSRFEEVWTAIWRDPPPLAPVPLAELSLLKGFGTIGKLGSTVAGPGNIFCGDEGHLRMYVP